MDIISSVNNLKEIISNIKIKGKTTGFVPTMGALHKGHISLVKQAAADNNVVIASIFVNPTQFNDKNDLANYPRMVDKDISMLEPLKVDYIFTPSVSEMYPGTDNMSFDFGDVDKVLEGKHRPGHFNGVAQIVYKFFTLIQPDKAYFGEKDFQQLIIIKQLVQNYKLNIEIVPCTIIREPDGLAMSSRNLLLSSGQRKSAVLISETLNDSLNYVNKFSVDGLKEWVINNINKDPQLDTEYFEIVNDVTLKTVNSWDDSGRKVGLIAVKVGKIRLIDNIRYNL